MEEEIRLLSIFPEEVWLIILKELIPKNSSRAYPFYHKSLLLFQKLLRPNLNKILFPSMLSVLHKWCQKQSPPDNDADLVILSFRKICRDWKTDVDLLLESRLYPTDFDNEIRYEIGDTVTDFVNEFSDVEGLQAFQQQFDATHLPYNANPFITAAVEFNFTVAVDIREMQDFLEGCVAVLTHYGSHVRNCVINMQAYSGSFCLNWLRRTLNLTPNLKSLRIRREELSAGVLDWNNLEGNFVQYIPALEKLEFLEMEMLPTVVANELLFRNGHVPKIAAKVQYETDCLPSLRDTQELSVSIDGIVLDYPPADGYPEFHWEHLRKLELNLRLSRIPITRIFSFLEYNFAETLQELRLFVPNSIIEDMPAVGLLKLKKLQVLKLHLPEVYCLPKIFCSLNFLVPLKNSLQELSVWRELESSQDIDSNECFELVKKKHNIQFFSVRSELRKSNMWDMFPQLEGLSYICSGKTNSCCTRQQWKDYTSS